MVLAFALAALTLSGLVQVSHIFVLAALLGLVNAFDIPARQAFIVQMVEKEDLINAIALNSSLLTAHASWGRPLRACWWPPSARVGASLPTA
jgi:hypothetical protein